VDCLPEKREIVVVKNGSVDEMREICARTGFPYSF